MRLTYLIFCLTLNAWAQTKPQIQVLPEPRKLEDFEHQFKGCPENSECDQPMGMLNQKWKDLINKLKNDKITPLKKARFLELFRSKYGIPTEFYTYQKSQLSFKPILFNSPCKNHNPKDPEAKVLRGTAFLKSLSVKEAVIWRDQTKIELPIKGILIPQPVVVFYPTGAVTYQLSLMDQPLFIKNKDLYVLKEEDDFFYMLKVSPDGKWKIEHLDFSGLSRFEEKRQNVSCPKDGPKGPAIFAVEFCKSVWDQSSKESVVVKMHQGCAT